MGTERLDPVVLVELRSAPTRSLPGMIVDAACYQLGQRVAGEFDYEEAGRLITESDTFAWVGLHEPSPEEFEKAVKTFNLHELRRRRIEGTPETQAGDFRRDTLRRDEAGPLRRPG